MTLNRQHKGSAWLDLPVYLLTLSGIQCWEADAAKPSASWEFFSCRETQMSRPKVTIRLANHLESKSHPQSMCVGRQCRPSLERLQQSLDMWRGGPDRRLCDVILCWRSERTKPPMGLLLVSVTIDLPFVKWTSWTWWASWRPEESW